MQREEARHDEIRDLARRASNLGLPMGALQAISELRARLAELEHDAVDAAREHGATWADIAHALRISRQGLHQRLTHQRAGG